ncbi:hypothetical protein GCM10023340_15490 [Nocardioides marinquilinus]|uniref:DUF2690 domain-containing protein n=1 Tax=Nocardioides marinquilinus TaxID=1210400 RepID=A0ABP9PG94_9ACTN
MTTCFTLHADAAYPGHPAGMDRETGSDGTGSQAVPASGPPAIGSCRPVNRGLPSTFADQFGRYLRVSLRYRCAESTPFNIVATVYRNPNSSNDSGFYSDLHEGVSRTPQLSFGVGRCRSERATGYRVGYDIRIDNRPAVYYQTPIVRLRCGR